DVFSAADVEAEPLAAALTEAVERVSPKRVFIDSMTQLRFLAPDLFQYRKQVLSLLRFLRDRGATVVFSSERSRDLPDDDLQFIADGVISLGSAEGAPTLEVTKFRGSGFRRGPHQYRVGGRGLEVFPRPLPHGRCSSGRSASSGGRAWGGWTRCSRAGSRRARSH